jgi:hypothetical protein
LARRSPWLATKKTKKYWDLTNFSLIVGNVVNISATCHPDTCCSCIFDDIFNVTNTVTGSQSWLRVGKIPRHNICEARTKLLCRQWTSSSVTRGMVMLPTHQQTSSWHRWWWQDMSPKMGACRHDTTLTFPTKVWSVSQPLFSN